QDSVSFASSLFERLKRTCNVSHRLELLLRTGTKPVSRKDLVARRVASFGRSHERYFLGILVPETADVVAKSLRSNEPPRRVDIRNIQFTLRAVPVQIPRTQCVIRHGDTSYIVLDFLY